MSKVTQRLHWLFFSIALIGCQSEESEPSGDLSLDEVDLVGCLSDPGCEYVYASGHRGASMFVPENTLLGIEEAISRGVTVVEVDVRPTSDDVLVLMHDATIDRTTTGSGLLSDLTYAELSSFEAVSNSEGVDNQPIPTFVEALEFLVGRALVDVDVKTDRYDLVVRDVELAGAEEWVNVQVGNIDQGVRLAEMNADLRAVPDVESAADLAEHIAAYDVRMMRSTMEFDG